MTFKCPEQRLIFLIAHGSGNGDQMSQNVLLDGVDILGCGHDITLRAAENRRQHLRLIVSICVNQMTDSLHFEDINHAGWQDFSEALHVECHRVSGCSFLAARARHFFCDFQNSKKRVGCFFSSPGFFQRDCKHVSESVVTRMCRENLAEKFTGSVVLTAGDQRVGNALGCLEIHALSAG